MLDKYSKYPVLSVVLSGLLSLPVLAADEERPAAGPTNADIVNRLDNLERSLQGQGLLDILQKLQNIETELSQLRGQIELQNHSLEQLKQRQRDIYTDLDRRIQRLQTAGTTTTPSLSPSDVPPLEEVPPLTESSEIALEPADTALEIKAESTVTETAEIETESVTTTEDEIPDLSASQPAETNTVVIESEYQKAFNLLKRSEYEKAIKSFENFLLNYPASKYSDNAQYWLAEAYYVTRRYDEAIDEYNKLVSLYPESQKVTHSLLKMGYSHLELGQIEEGKTVLSTLRDHYPGTTAARLAEDRLRQIGDS